MLGLARGIGTSYKLAPAWEASIKVLDRLAKLYGITIDQIVNPTYDPTKEVAIEDKTSTEQIKLIQQLDEKDGSIVMSIIDTMLTKKKFKDFFSKNVGSI